MCALCGYEALKERVHGPGVIKPFSEFSDDREDFRQEPWESFKFMVKKEHEYATTAWAMKEVFQTFPEEIVYEINNEDFLDILVAAKVFSSRTQAQKNGHDKALPLGWFDKHFGKRKVRINIFNPI